jgi:hypothetical protein
MRRVALTDAELQTFQHMCEDALRDRAAMFDGLNKLDPHRVIVEREMQNYRALRVKVLGKHA